MSAAALESSLLELLSAVETGDHRDMASAIEELSLRGYVVSVDGRACLTPEGVAKVWALREQRCVSLVLRQNPSLEPGMVARIVRRLRSD